MHLDGKSGYGPVLNAITMALKTGNVNYVLAWMPEEYEKKMKNLFEKAVCEQRIGKDVQGVAVDLYITTVNKLYCAHDRALFDCKENARFDECVLIAQRAIETGDETEVIALVPKMLKDEVMYRFHNLLEKKDYDTNNVAAGRAYVAAFTEFIRYFTHVSTGRPRIKDPKEDQICGIIDKY